MVCEIRRNTMKRQTVYVSNASIDPCYDLARSPAINSFQPLNCRAMKWGSQTNLPVCNLPTLICPATWTPMPKCALDLFIPARRPPELRKVESKAKRQSNKLIRWCSFFTTVISVCVCVGGWYDFHNSHKPQPQWANTQCHISLTRNNTFAGRVFFQTYRRKKSWDLGLGSIAQYACFDQGIASALCCAQWLKAKKSFFFFFLVPPESRIRPVVCKSGWKDCEDVWLEVKKWWTKKRWKSSTFSCFRLLCNSRDKLHRACRQVPLLGASACKDRVDGRQGEEQQVCPVLAANSVENFPFVHAYEKMTKLGHVNRLNRHSGTLKKKKKKSPEPQASHKALSFVATRGQQMTFFLLDKGMVGRNEVKWMIACHLRLFINNAKLSGQLWKISSDGFKLHHHRQHSLKRI